MKQCSDKPLSNVSVSCCRQIPNRITLRAIPLKTATSYHACNEGHIWREGKKMKGHDHPCKKNGKVYRRYHIKMKDGKYRNFYGHRLVAMAWLGSIENKIVRHLSDNEQYNAYTALTIGTYEDNNVTDRIIAGNYMNRGKKQEEEECPF